MLGLSGRSVQCPCTGESLLQEHPLLKIALDPGMAYSRLVGWMI